MVINQIWDTLSNFRAICEFIYDIAVNKCPCKTGCRRCMLSLDLVNLGDIEKTLLFETFKDFYENPSEIEEKLEFKVKGFHHNAKCLRYYQKLRDYVFELFENKFDLVIKNKDPNKKGKEKRSSSNLKKTKLNVITDNKEIG